VTQVRQPQDSQRPSLRQLVRHPVGTLRSGHHKTINAYGFGLGLLAAVVTFVAVITMWLVGRLGPLLLQ
jgi:hypothetical protein